MTVVILNEIFSVHLAKVKFNGNLAKSMYKYQLGYVNSNREHLEFFGGNLLGVQVVRFKDSDVAKLFNDILDVDFVKLSSDLETVTDINQDFKISSDVFNLTIMYLIHRFLSSNEINDVQKKRAAYDCAVIFFYRCLAALISYNFRYPADPKVAQMAYANLSNKYLIKRLGSWHKVVDYRANDLTGKESIHYKKLKSFNDDLAIVYAINDSQGRIRDLIKNYYGEFIKVHNEGTGIGTVGGTYFDAEGEETVKEKTKSVESYVTYIRSIVMDKHSFVDNDVISVINHINKNTSIRMINQVLAWMSDQYGKDNHNLIDQFMSTVIVSSFHMLEDNATVVNKKDYPKILIELKNLYLSTRSTDPDLVVIRKLGESIVKKSSSVKLSDSLVYSTRTSIILYLTLKALIGK